MRQSDWRKSLGNAFIGIGLILLLGAGGMYWWEQWQAQNLRAELEAEPTMAVAALVERAATLTPLPTLVPTAVPTSAPTAVPTVAPTVAAHAKPAAAAPAPSQEPTATRVPTATPAPTRTATPAPTAIPASKPVRIAIPDLKIDIPVTDMTWTVVNTPSGPESDWQIPEYAAGHAVNSALLGEPGNMVISGHNNIYGRVFMRISQAWPDQGYQKVDAYTDRAAILNGRQVIVTGADGRRVAYVITAFYRVKDSGVPEAQRIKNADYLTPTDNMQLTLTTCWPPWSNTHRLIVIAQPVN